MASLTFRKTRVPRISLSALILLSMAVGILTGLFFGELVGFLDIIGDIWLKLLQMTVLPYVVLSLILGLGRLNYKDALLLAKKGGSMLLLLWFVTLAVVFMFPQVFPDWEASSVFAALDVPDSKPVDFLGLYIPSNPFYALANNLVPAVVLFSIALGIALIGVPNKEKILDGMGLLIDTLTRIANFVVKLTPLGVFAIMASSAGSMSFAEFQRLEIYIYSYIAVSLVMSLWILPGLVTMLTSLSYREVVGSTRDALITAFATTSLFVVLPMLMEKSKEMVARHTGDRQKADSAVEVIVPASFNFPHAGKLFTLTFILFAGWHSGYPLDVSDYPRLIAAGVASLFANVNLAIPFLFLPFPALPLCHSIDHFIHFTQLKCSFWPRFSFKLFSEFMQVRQCFRDRKFADKRKSVESFSGIVRMKPSAECLSSDLLPISVPSGVEPRYLHYCLMREFLLIGIFINALPK